MVLPPAIPVCILLVTSPIASAEIYRCERQGLAVFTDVPCDTDAAPLQIQTPNLIEAGLAADLARQHDERLKQEHGERDQADALWLQAHEQAKSREQNTRRAIVEGRVIKGMTAAQVRQVWGEPTEVQSGDKAERWIYKDKRRRSAVSFVDERVSAVSGSGPAP